MGSDLVTVAVARNVTEAGLYRATLEQAGIPAFVADEGIVSLHWFLSNAVGGIKVQVSEDLATEAREILRTTAVAVDPEDADQLASLHATCPECASADLRPYARTQARNILASVLSFFLFPVPVPVRENRVECCACGRVFPKP